MTTLIPKYDQGSTGAVNRPINLKLAESVSVKDFGAVGDGTTDDTVAIQAALNSLPSLGGSIYLPSGTYLIKNTININNRVHFYGDGFTEVNTSPAITVIKKSATFTDNAAIIINAAAGASILENFTVDGASGNQFDGIQVFAPRVVIRQVSVINQGRHGIRIGADTAGINCNIWRLDQIVLSNNTNYGLFINSNGQNANSGCATGVTASSNQTGVFLQNCAANTFVNCHCESNTTYGLYFHPTSNHNIFVGGDFENNTTKNIYIDTPTYGNNELHAANVDITTVTDLDPNTCWFGYQKIKSPGIQGTWTPSLGSISGQSVSPSYSLQSGDWVRIGNLVTVHYRIILTSSGSGWVAPEVYLFGLPFTAASGNPGTAETVQIFASTATSLISMGILTNGGTKNAYLTKQTAASTNNASQLVYSDINNTTTIKGTFTYITSDI